MAASTNEMAAYRKVFPYFSALKQYQRLPDFSSRNRLHHFNVGVTPQNSMDYLSSYVIVWLCRVPPYDGDIKVLYRVSILNADGDKCCTEEIPTEFHQDYDWRPVTGGTYVINRAYLMDSRNKLLTNDQLTIVCEVEILNQDLVEIDPNNQYIGKQDCKSAKSTPKGIEYLNYFSLLKNFKYSDVDFLVSGKQFKLHKAILAAQSPAFSAMFDRSKVTNEKSNKANPNARKCNWIIANFASQRNTLVKSIPLLAKTKCTCQLTLCPALPRNNDNDCTLLSFSVKSCEAPKIRVNYKIEILNKLGQSWQTQTGQIEYNSTVANASYPELNIDRSYLLAPANGMLSSAGELVINCEVDCVDKIDLNPTKIETNLEQIKITDVRVFVLINFVYTGKITSLEKFAHELFVASDKYQINSLKNLCELHLSKNLNIESVIETLILADKHRASVLKEKSLGFIVANAKEVKSAKNGLKLLKTQPDLMLEVLDLLSDK